MTERFLRYKNSSLHYTIMGNGAKILLLFHGFGQDHKIFRTLTEPLTDIYTIYLFDLYFHGKSKWGYDELPLEKEHWYDTIQLFIDENAIEKFCLAGFSLGGKFVMATLESFPSKTEAVFLMAPDGIKTSFWYSLATYPVIFRKVFKSMIRHHGRFMAIVSGLKFLGLVDKGLIRFAEHQMNTEEKRSRVYYSWVVFRRLNFNMDHIATLVNKYKIPFTLITGKYDKVIRSENMEGLTKRLNNCRSIVVESGHNALIEASIPFMKNEW